eukprot:scaffold181549_cov64-Attheya_sp.AAC.2
MPLQGWEGGQTNNQQSAQSSNFKLSNLLQQNNDPTGTFGTRLTSLPEPILIPQYWCCVGKTWANYILFFSLNTRRLFRRNLLIF